MRATLRRVQNARGYFVLQSPVSLASRDQGDVPVELNDRHPRSHGKKGDCEQSTEHYKLDVLNYMQEYCIQQICDFKGDYFGY